MLPVDSCVDVFFPSPGKINCGEFLFRVSSSFVSELREGVFGEFDFPVKFDIKF